MSEEDYRQFINRTAIYINYQFVQKNNIQTIVVPASSSPLLADVVENLSLRNQYVTYFKTGFVKNAPVEIIINKEHPQITSSDIKRLEKLKEKAKQDGFFEMKRVDKKLRKFVSNIFELNPDVTMRNHVNGSNVMLIDDIVNSGATTADMIRSLEVYAPEKLLPVTLFKIK